MTSVLIVDDDPKIRRSLCRAMAGEPYDFYEACCGETAMEVLAQQHIDVLVTDVVMPGMCGCELLKKCRDRYPDMVRIAMTGFGSLEVATSTIYDGGIFYYLEKPVSKKQLALVIHGALAIRDRKAELASDVLIMGIEQQQALLQRYHITPV